MANGNLNKVEVLIVGGGPAGLSCAIQLKVLSPETEVCVIEKGAELGNHNLSGAVLEKEPLHTLLDAASPGWQNTDAAKDVFANKIDKDNVLFLLGKKFGVNIHLAIRMAKVFGLGFGQMDHRGDYSVSISKLTKWLGQIAKSVGVEILTGFAASDIITSDYGASAVKLIDQGLNKEGQKQPNYIEGETIQAKFIVLAEGCEGLLTEKFVEKAGLKRDANQLFSLGVKQLIKVSPEQYAKFTAGRVVHAMGYPIWTPVIGPAMFGGGILYAGQQDHLSVGMIVGADWKYNDFNPQDALTLFKEHSRVKQFIGGGTIVEAGAKMIPEAGWHAVPRDPVTGSIGKGNVLIIGDSAGFVNMLKIKGLHNAIDSGMQAAKAIAFSINSGKPSKPQIPAAVFYTVLIKQSNVAREMMRAATFRQTVAKFGPLIGMPLSVLGTLLPLFDIEPDYKAMTTAKYRLKPDQTFDKDTFTAMAGTNHREDQPSHLTILNSDICRTKCTPVFKSPCITFCPAGVYETVQGVVKPANPSNCLHCKTCRRKCPFDNIRWTCPEGTGGPRYKRM
ncbi:MAG: 4Fe-4S dicluster domain-containing protein [Sedimentisphaerales bacterium]|nr:4Fe-4S dicluster domain-containing protein [Sedimentisphaerales bacterium]